MPFEIAPKQPAVVTKRAPFGHYAAALLRGCAQSGPAFGTLVHHNPDGTVLACAMGALAIGFGQDPRAFDCSISSGDIVNRAYYAKYNATIPQDNDSRRYTREQIAARIAAI